MSPFKIGQRQAKTYAFPQALLGKSGPDGAVVLRHRPRPWTTGVIGLPDEAIQHPPQPVGSVSWCAIDARVRQHSMDHAMADGLSNLYQDLLSGS
jgi:hypothetical protein